LDIGSIKISMSMAPPDRRRFGRLVMRLMGGLGMRGRTRMRMRMGFGGVMRRMGRWRLRF
jgi:hypothetical protein